MKACELLALTSLLLLDAPHERAEACGASAVTDVGLLMAPARDVVSDLLADPYEGLDTEPMRFFTPFRLAGRDVRDLLGQAEQVADAATDGLTVPVDDAPMLRAIEAGDLPRASREAKLLVSRVLDLPTPLANGAQPQLSRAVEFLELAPGLAALSRPLLTQFFVSRSPTPLSLPPLLSAAQRVRDTPRDELPALFAAEPAHPRAASLAFVALGMRVKRELPSGWPGHIDAPAALWDDLLRAHDAWLKAYPDHPLQGFLRLSKLRVLFLRGDGKRAFDLLLGMYPRHPLRAVWEMRHVLRAGLSPAHVNVQSLQDPVLASAFLRESTALSADAWSALWHTSTAAGNTPWATNFQERLFVHAMRLAAEGKAPVDLQGAPEERGARWNTLHAAALLAASRFDESLAQSALGAAGGQAELHLLRLRAQLCKGDFVGAAEAAEMHGAETLAYTLDVLADEAALRTLSGHRGKLGSRALHALALRHLQQAGVAAAAGAFQGHPGLEASTWQEAARRAADGSPEGRVAFSRWLLSPTAKRILPEAERAYSRGLKRRLDQLEAPAASPPAPAPCPIASERDRLVGLLLFGGRREQALVAIAQALAQTSARGRRGKALLHEGDGLYNRLLSWDASYSEAFPRALAGSEAARTLRAVGKAQGPSPPAP
ncbi:MAG: hypothetical protein RL385_3693 [Pseudomonadota bacterium]|jgi:hypothetical protein